MLVKEGEPRKGYFEFHPYTDKVHGKALGIQSAFGFKLMFIDHIKSFISVE